MTPRCHSLAHWWSCKQTWKWIKDDKEANHRKKWNVW